MTRNHLFLAPPGWQDPLGVELGLTFPGRSVDAVSDRWWIVEGSAAGDSTPCLAFALQSLPDADLHPSTSIRKDADAIALLLRERLAESDFPFHFHVFAPYGHPDLTAGKAKLLRSAILESLKRRAKSLLPRISQEPPGIDYKHGLVQATWISPQTLAVSALNETDGFGWRRCLSPWPGGVAPINEDRRPPSRAYRKLLEALAQMNASIQRGETVVDLAASPGGWTFIALESGATAVAVDRSPLADELMNHRRLKFVQGDAFKFAPEAPVDWMIADIAAFPERTLELVKRWLSEGWCRRLVATVKFTGTENYAALEEFKEALSSLADDFRIRKLLENKNEATVMAWRTSTGRTDEGSPATATEA
jgi:23S rRNA (cytidine2498-2'-O)-methyltransferase